MEKEQKRKINSFYENYISPFKEEYIMFGGLILLFTLLKDSFGVEGLSSFLLAIILFCMALVLLFTCVKLFMLIIIKRISPLSFFYFLLYPLFALLFFVIAYEKFPPLFNVFMGLFLSVFIAIVFADLRLTIVILEKKISIFLKKEKFRKIFKKSWRILFILLILIINTYILVTIEKRVGLESKDLTSMSNDELFFFPIKFFYSLNFLMVFIISIIDLFRKEPLYSEEKNWKNLWTISYIIRLKKYYEENKK